MTTNPSNVHDADPATGQAPLAPLSMVNMGGTDQADDLSVACVALGATVTREQPGDGRWQVLLDPAGHPFCVSLAETAS